MGKSINKMLSEWLKVLGFKAMSGDVLREKNPNQLKRYAQIVANNANNSEVVNRLEKYNLLNKERL